MTLSDNELSLTPTQGLAAAHKFYPTKINVPHHQLRHFISTAEGDFIYYASGYDVFAVDLAAQQNSLIATVPFEARCLAADMGYVCVGGEVNGDCAFMKLSRDKSGHPTCFGHDLVVELLGGEIVNSMNIHNLTGDGSTPDEPVNLISNNDKTVKIYSLAQRKVLNTFPHPVPMNFATMSPDCSVVAAVGDSDKVYFYRRLPAKDATPSDGRAVIKYAKYDWELFAEPVVPTGDPVYDDYSFAIAFSPSGHLCAASSQGGSITVFDMRKLLEPDGPAEKAIHCTFRSSRPTLWGCVRAMAFSPAPWDILAWAEDHGRIGLADLRRSFVRRQTLELDRSQLDTVQLDDGTPVAYRSLGIKERLKSQHAARLRVVRGEAAREGLAEPAPDETRAEASRRHSRQDLINYHQSLDLDDRERSVIAALETTMDDMQQVAHRPYVARYPSLPRIRDSASPTDSPRDDGGPAASRSRIVRTPPPRRRGSVLLSESSAGLVDPNEGQRAAFSASPGQMDEDEEISIISAVGITSSAATVTPSQSNIIPTTDPWHVIQSALESARESDLNNRATLARIEAALEDERQLGTQLERQLADERQLSTLLRRQLDTQQRLLTDNLSQLEQLRVASRGSNARIESSLQRVFQRQLANEQRFLQQRSQELQTELNVGLDYYRRLELERARLLAGTSAGGSDSHDEAGNAEASSAQTSTLPTLNVGASPSTDNLSNILTDYAEHRHLRLAHIQNLQRQVRRAESRVDLATADIHALEHSIRHEIAADNTRRRRGDGDDESSRSPASTSSRTEPRPRHESAPTEPPRPATVRRLGLGPAPVAQAARNSEAGGRDNDAEMRLARMMFLSGVAGNRSLDSNGNWSAGITFNRLLAAGASLTAGRTAEEPATTSAADVIRDMGPGTAGIGFSPDGRYLYAGSEEGIFEFKINLRDRMTFPAFEMR